MYQEVEFVLTGGRTGETVLLGKHSFINGRAKILVSPENFGAVLTVMARSHQAFPAGSEELAIAQERDRANGILSDIPPNPASSDGAPAPVQGSGDNDAGSLSDPRTLQRSVDASDQAGSEGMVSRGSGHENAGLGERVEPEQNRESDALIVQATVAISKLDPTIDEQWTEGGLPSVEYLAEATKNPAMSRELIEHCAPGFNRIKAEDLLAGKPA